MFVRKLTAEAFYRYRCSRKIEQQSIFKIGGFEITAANGEMNVLQLEDRFQFNDDLAFNEEIQTVFADLVIAVEERYRMLPDELDSTERKFNSHRFLVEGFQKTRTKCSVHSDCASNNFLRKFRVSEIFSCFPAFLIHIFKWFLSRRLFPSRGRGPWGR
jgi:hypothetical protein